jgi:hypothetical protein
VHKVPLQVPFGNDNKKGKGNNKGEDDQKADRPVS